MTKKLLVMALLAQAAVAAQPRVILVDVDGIRRDTLEAAYLSGNLPNLERVLGEVRDGEGFATAVWFDNAQAVFPAITMAGQASLATGVPPSRHGIPGNKWFERSTNRVMDYFSSMGVPCVYGVLLVSTKECSGGLANRHLNTTTLYEAATAAGKTSTVVFHEYWTGATRVVLPPLSAANQLLQVGSAVNYEKFDQVMMDEALASLRKDGLPDLLTLYFIGADGVGHHRGTEAQKVYLAKTFDPLLGRLLDTLEEQDPMWREHTQFILTSDHGRTDTQPSREDAVLHQRLEEALERQGYPADDHRVVENGGVVHIYLKSKVMASKWNLEPRPEDVWATAQALAKDPVLNGTIEVVAARENGSGYGYRLTSTDREDASTLTAMLATLEGPRSGDIVLLLGKGRYFDNKEASGAQHGSMFAQDLSIPLVIAQGGAHGGRTLVPISTTDVPKIIAAYLGFAFQPR